MMSSAAMKKFIDSPWIAILPCLLAVMLFYLVFHGAGPLGEGDGGGGPQIGSPAPEIEGEDIDGRRFKLSDYRGKVVMLDFWGNW